jgi:hypothetical protein
MHDASDFPLSDVSAKDPWDGTMFTSPGAPPSSVQSTVSVACPESLYLGLLSGGCRERMHYSSCCEKRNDFVPYPWRQEASHDRIDIRVCSYVPTHNEDVGL